MQIRVQENRKFWASFLLIMAILLSFYPYEFQDSLFPLLRQELITKTLFSILLIVLLLFQNYVKVSDILILLAGVHMVGFFVSWLAHGGVPQYLGEYATIIMVLLIIITIEFKIGIVRFFELYNKWILIMLIGGCVALVMAIMGIPPFKLFINSRDLRPAFSWGVSYTNVYYDNFIRFSGYFDEPGAMGYWTVFAIAINRLFIKNKKMEWLLLILGLFTFSFGYIIQALVFLVLFAFDSVKGKKSWGTLTIVILVFTMGFLVYSSDNDQFSIIRNVTFGRFETMSESDQMMEGRGAMTEAAKRYFLENPIMGLGRVQFASIPQYLQDNPYETLAKDGIFGTLYLYFPFLLLLHWGVKRRDRELLKVWVFMILGFMHRPFHAAPLYYFIFYSIVYMYYNKMKHPQLYESTT